MRAPNLTPACLAAVLAVAFAPAAHAAGSRLHITEGGTPDHPRVYAGGGKEVSGIDVDADWVVVDGYTLTKPSAPGVELRGSHVTLQNTTITAPHGGDGDGIRFFGDDIAILHNTVRQTSNRNGHADCMQTFASDTPPSNHVRIEGNRCEQIDNMCVMAEGPNDGEGDGKGHTTDFVIKDNFCETRKASQALMFEDVQRATITGNTFAAGPDHAIGLAIHSTGAHVEGNHVDPSIRCEVGIDKSSREGYTGPEPRCAP
ncbi:right-handed parallel beta-helix repeat-containing protein [Amycolatopsis jejuensis]|uniref:right-handed parallel beta-helix repeat-containing protein n=1 Tax=Amycolatopsis jejuensis TaxID=330084 RepID=UPI0005248414|nr:right-handed parallel beta-helix repeat-containing protein [Amycolatopsis jejuensis]